MYRRCDSYWNPEKWLWVYGNAYHRFILRTCIFTMWDKVEYYAHFTRDLLFCYGKFNQTEGKDLSWFNIKIKPEHIAMNYLYDLCFDFVLNGKNYLLSLYSFNPSPLPPPQPTHAPHLNLLIYSPFTNS